MLLSSSTLIPSIPAADLDRAKQFYEGKLGLDPIAADGDTARYRSGDSWFLLYKSDFAGTNQATAAALEVEDFDASISELKARGVAFQDYDFGDEFRTFDGVFTAPDGAKVAWIKDSEGNTIGIASA